MCGISGLVSQNKISKNLLIDLINNMNNSLKHRGPNSSGFFLDEINSTVLGHTRLSILDLSSAGNQPMTSLSKRYTIVYNGEIYNHLDIRKKINLEFGNYNWTGHSDTETLLACFDLFGLSKTLELIEGMYAFSILDNFKKEIILIRDRAGEKPLYFGWINNNGNNFFVFCSELKALKKLNIFNNSISNESLMLFLKYSYIPSPLSIYENIFKLEPATFFQVKISNIFNINKNPNKIVTKKYWDIKKIIKNHKSDLITNENQAIETIHDKLNKVVSDQLISDVPIGSFLSGGLDSSIVTALMQANSLNKVKTFTIGFENKDYDESIYSKKIAKYLNTDHTEIILNDLDIINAIHSMPYIYDEPFADSSQIPTHLICKNVSRKISVALTGDGGDEVFGGYNRHILIPSIMHYLSYLPERFKKVLSYFLLNISNKKLDLFGKLLQFNNKYKLFGDKVHDLSRNILGANNIYSFYENTISTWINPNEIYNTNYIYDNLNTNRNSIFTLNKIINDSEKIMLLDFMNYLHNDIMCKVDRASMSESLETRSPFLNHKLIETSWKIPFNMKISNKKGKYIIRKILSKYLPEKLFNYPKSGFSVPIGDFFLSNKKSSKFVEEILFSQTNKIDDLFNNTNLQNIWNTHKSNKINYSNQIWNIIMLKLWLNS